MLRFAKPPKAQRSTIIFPALMAYWFAYCINVLDENRLHPNSIDAALAIVMGLLSGGAWLATTPARLRELKLNQAWIAALVAPFVLSIFALWNRWNILVWSMLVVGVLAQSLLVFLETCAAPEAEQFEESAGPTA